MTRPACPRPFSARLRRWLWPALALLLTAVAALPAQGAWSPQFDQTGLGIGGRVFALGTYRNELIAGLLNSPWRDGHRLERIGRFDGKRWYPLGSGLAGGGVRAAVEFQGHLYVAGAFLGATNGVWSPGVARWTGSQWQAVGAGLDGEVFALCVHQGALYAAGDFTTSGSATVRGIARWTGSQWVEVGGGVHRTQFFATVARALASDGTDLYVGGEFDRAGTVPANRIAAWNGTSWRALGSGITGTWVWTLLWHGGRLFAGGSFSHAGGQLADGFAAWNGSQWQPLGIQPPGTLGASRVYSLGAWNGDVYVGGAFRRLTNPPMAGLARFDGAQLHGVPGGFEVTELGPPTVYALAAWQGRLYAGGEFDVVGDLDAPAQAVAVHKLAAFDGSAWHPVGDGHGASGEVHVLGRWQGQPVAGGRFTTLGGALGFGLARFDGDQWRTMGEFDGLVTGLTEHQGELWVAGQFFRVDGQIADGVARYDGQQWHAVGGGPGAARAYAIASYQGQIHIGTAGGPKRWTGTAWQTFTPVLTGVTTALHVHNGVLYLGGAHGGSLGPNLYAWDGATLSVPGGGLNEAVEGLGSWNGELVVGGRFTRAGNLNARAIARWNGSTWSSFGGGIAAATVKAIAGFGGELVIGGDFNSIQGAPADHVARWTGTAWAPLAAAQPDGVVYALLPDDARGELLVGGWFLHVGSMDSTYLAAYERTPYWTGVGAGLGTARRTPSLRGSGRLVAGSQARWELSSAHEQSLALFVVGLAAGHQPLLGATLVPTPDATLLLPTDGAGTATLALAWPAGLSGLRTWTQAFVLDPTAATGVTASPAVWLRAP